MDKFLKKIGISENTVSLVLGILVVIALAFLAYNFFKVKPQAPGAVNQEQTTNESGELTLPTAAVALPTEHTVAAGENLWSIAEKYYTSGYNWVDIASVNQIVNPDNIYVGQTLTIPNVAVRVATATTTQIAPRVSLATITGESYTVIRGDNLWTIAVRAYGDGYRYGDIASANHLAHPRLIHAGNVLVIPRP